MANLIDKDATLKLKNPQHTLWQPLNISTIVRGPIDTGLFTQYTEPVYLQISGMHQEFISMLSQIPLNNL